jgi:hypothetical protein
MNRPSPERRAFQNALRDVQASGRALCGGFQVALSALLDGELPEQHARRTLAHLEACEDCAGFFKAIRLQALAHRDAAIPGSLARRLKRLQGEDLFAGLTDAEILRRLAFALYQLGKSYALIGTDGEYLVRVAEEPVEIGAYASGEAAEAASAAEESGALRRDVSGLLQRQGPESHLAKAHALLDESLHLKPRFAEARIYLGFVRQAQGDPVTAAAEYRKVFLQSDRATNRAHAAIQLGLLYDRAGDHLRARRMYRWVVASGTLHAHPEFAFVLYNLAVEHITLGELEKATALLRLIRDDYPELWATAKEWIAGSEHLLERLRSDDRARREIETMEPAFFAA